VSISAVIITLNEERNIGRCIDSLKEIVDEIIVVDSFSTDKTKDICQDKGVEFYQTEWKGYSATKNYGNSLAKHAYILSIDADECLSETLANNLKNVDLSNEVSYAFNRLTNYCGSWVKHCGWYPDRKIRLFPKSKAIWTGDYVHEILEIKALKEAFVDGDLWHYSYYNRKEHRSRADKYSLLTAKKMHALGKTCSRLKPYLSAMGKFLSIYLLKLGILDRSAGWHIAIISAQSNVLKYKELLRLNEK